MYTGFEFGSVNKTTGDRVGNMWLSQSQSTQKPVQLELALQCLDGFFGYLFWNFEGNCVHTRSGGNQTYQCLPLAT